MGFKALVFVAVALCLGYVSAVLNTCNEKLQYFVCDPASPNYATILGSKVECPEKTMCNMHYIGTTTVCEACLPYETPADISYTCTDTGFTMGGKPFECPQYTKCEAVNQFPVCKPQECAEDEWKCLDNGMVILNELEGYCKVGTKCNADFKYPCKPCIPADDEGMDFYQNSGASTVIASTVILSIVAMCAIQHSLF